MFRKARAILCLPPSAFRLPPSADPNTNPDIIWKAIEQRRLIGLRYKNRDRIVESHDHGIHNGTIEPPRKSGRGPRNQKLPNPRWKEGGIAGLTVLEVQKGTFSDPGSEDGKLVSDREIRCVLNVRFDRVMWDTIGSTLPAGGAWAPARTSRSVL